MERLVSSDHGPGYFAPPTGLARVLYVTDRNLMSQELDETRPGLLGEPQLEVSQIASAGSFAFFSIAGSGTLVYRHGVAGAPSANELTWFDRKGQVLGPAADRGGYGAFTLSPDGRRVAVSMTAAGRPPDLWMIDVERKINTRFTADGATNQFPIWSADGSHIVFRSNRAGRFDLYEKHASGLEPERLLLQTPFDKIPASASADGRFLLFDATSPQGGTDIWLLTRGGATPAASPLIASAFNELQAVFSPDGRLIAYVSDESGRPEVHVRTFTPPGQPAAPGAGQWRISNGGGTRPRWRADGKELFYRADTLLMSVAIDSAASRFTPASPVLLFDSQSIISNSWDVSADGQRFLLAVAPETRSSEPITVVLNWRPGGRQP
jgi:Tol biopolymer transport system component